MYCKFFGLDRPPFNNTPDPKFFFETPQHEEALASLRYTAEQRKGFVLVTGEVGSGKTLLGRLLIQQLGSRARTATIASSALSPHELMATLCGELEVALDPNANKTQLIQALQDYLLDKHGKDRLVVVLLDEAQNLPIDSFEELRMLGNLEADDAKLLQVLILAQPEILGVLRRPEMKQLRQRIVRTVHLSELTRIEAAGYIAHRLAVAGGDGKVEFAPSATELIHVHSRGVPRLINQICDQALLTAYARSVTTIDTNIVQEAIDGIATLHGDGFETPYAEPVVPGQIELAQAEPAPSQGPQEAGAIHPVQHAAPQAPVAGVSDVTQPTAGVAQDTDRLVAKTSRRGKALHQSLSKELRERMRQVRAVLAELRRDADGVVEQTGRRGEEIQRSLAESMEEHLSRARRSLAEVGQDADKIVETVDQHGETLKESLTEALDTQLRQMQESLTGLREEAERIVESTSQRGETVQKSLDEALEAQVEHIQETLEMLREDAGSIAEKVNRRSREMHESVSAELEGRLGQIRETLAELSQDADQIVQNTERRGEELRDSLSEQLGGRLGQIQETLGKLRQDADQIVENTERRGEELRNSLSEQLGGRLGQIEETLGKLNQGADQFVTNAERRGQALRESLSEQLGGRLGQIQDVLTQLSRDADNVLEEAQRRSEEIRQTLSEDLEDRIGRVDQVLIELSQEADKIVEETSRRSAGIQRSLSEDLEKRAAELEQTLASLGKEADDIAERSSHRGAELRDLCDAMRAVTQAMTDESDQAKAQCDKLAQENAQARELTPVVQEARQTIALLGQSHKHADKHTRQLAEHVERAEALLQELPERIDQLEARSLSRIRKHAEEHVKQAAQQVERADELVRDVPQLIDQLQAAATEARMAAGKLDNQTKGVAQRLQGQIKAMEERITRKVDEQAAAMKQQYQASQELAGACQGQIDQMTQLISQAGGLASVLTAVGQAVESTKAPAATAPSTAQEPRGPTAADDLYPGHESASDQTGSRVPRSGILHGGHDEAEDLPALIEFDPRRAAMAQRIANAQIRSIERSAATKSVPAKTT